MGDENVHLVYHVNIIMILYFIQNKKNTFFYVLSLHPKLG